MPWTPSPLRSAPSFQSASSTSSGTFSFNTGTTTTTTSVHSENNSGSGTSTGINTHQMEASNTANNEHGVGLSNPKMSQASRKMLDLVNGLHSTGVQVDIDLPRIVVVGNQSAGKSSLIESISGITLPRAPGTCTRCPTECRLSRSNSPWKCIVSLSTTTDSKGQPLGQSKNELFGPPIHNKKEVEDRIRRAQLAILNPHKPIESFLREDHSDSDGIDPTIAIDDDIFQDASTSLTFSMNYVSLAISGPDVADLTFVDLPGLIASVGKRGHPADIKLVKGLVTSYIKKPNCIILLTVTCETDFENQGAHELARTYDPEGKRTIGVLTKPDRISVGEESPWLRFIRNEKETLENGWFCVKQPSSNDLKEHWTWEEARRKEDEFFASTAPWNGLDGLYTKYLRTGNLVERLSNVLSSLIAKRLPEIQEEIEDMIRKTQEQIALLPKPPPKNALNEVARLIKDFDSSMRTHIEGAPDKDGIIQQIRVPSNRFRSVIRGTAPEFRPFSKPQGENLNMPEFSKPQGEPVGKPQVVFEAVVEPPQIVIGEADRPRSLWDSFLPKEPRTADGTSLEASRTREEARPSSSGLKPKKKSAMKTASISLWDQVNEKSESASVFGGEPVPKRPLRSEKGPTKPQTATKAPVEPEFLAHEAVVEPPRPVIREADELQNPRDWGLSKEPQTVDRTALEAAGTVEGGWPSSWGNETKERLAMKTAPESLQDQPSGGILFGSWSWGEPLPKPPQRDENGSIKPQTAIKALAEPEFLAHEAVAELLRPVIEEADGPRSPRDWRLPKEPQTADGTASEAPGTVEEARPSSWGVKKKKKSAMKTPSNQPNEKSKLASVSWGEPEFKTPQIAIKTPVEPEFLVHEAVLEPPGSVIGKADEPKGPRDWGLPVEPQTKDEPAYEARPSSSLKKTKQYPVKKALDLWSDPPQGKSETKAQGFVQPQSTQVVREKPEPRPARPSEKGPTKPQNGIKTLAEPEFLAHEEENLIELSNSLGVTVENRPIYIDEVYQRMEESRTRELPGYFPFVVQREYIKEALVKWDRPAIKLCDEVFAILAKCVRQLVREHFGSFGQGTLEHQIRLIMHEHLGQCLSEAKKKIEWLMKIQRDPFTLNNHYLVDYKVKFLTYYRRVHEDSKKYDSNLGGRHGPSDSSPVAESAPTDTSVAQALSALAKLGYHGLKADDLAKLLGHQNMEPAFEVMATVRAYFQVAYKRFIDNIPMAIDYELVRGGEQDIFQLLWARLGLDGPRAREMCDDYAQEALQVANRREELHKKLERLTEATRRLINVG